jgi:ribonuclease-3
MKLPTFADNSLLRRALTHRSFRNEYPERALEDNERLEFLGDAVLDFVSGALLYHIFPEMDEGRLTSLRAALVRTEKLAEIAAECGITEAMLLGRGEEESGGRRRLANLCGTFEAVIGALYIDQGLEAVRAYVEPLFEPLAHAIVAEELDRDPKSVLQVLAQSTYSATPYYRTISAEGPDHAKEFTVEVYVRDRAIGRGAGRSKQIAAMAAAQAAIAFIEDERARAADEPGTGTGEQGLADAEPFVPGLE